MLMPSPTLPLSTLMILPTDRYDRQTEGQIDKDRHTDIQTDRYYDDTMPDSPIVNPLIHPTDK